MAWCLVLVLRLNFFFFPPKLRLFARIGALFGPDGSSWVLGSLLVPAWLAVLATMGAYDLRHTGSGSSELAKLAKRPTNAEVAARLRERDRSAGPRSADIVAAVRFDRR